jgi:glycerate kinase
MVQVMYSAYRKVHSPEIVIQLESNLTHFANLIEKQLNITVQDIAGSGAAVD